MEFYKLPRILVIHIKRFKQQGYVTKKDGKFISYPIEGLDM
jgi:hypothetical protein